MSSNPLDGLQQRFTQFWEFAERETAEGSLLPKPLCRVTPNWKRFWDTEMLPSERQGIQRLVDALAEDRAAQERFVNWVEGWIRGRFPGHGAIRLVLAQLAQIPLFQSWERLRPYHPQNLNGAIAIILLQPEGHGGKEDIKSLICFVIPKEARDSSDYLLNLEANEPRRAIWEATRSILNGMTFWILFLGWSLLGKKCYPSWLNNTLRVFWALVSGVFLFLLTADPVVYLADRVLVSSLWGLVIAVPLLVLCPLLVSICRWWPAWRQGRKWSALLRQSQMCVLVNDNGAELTVDGPSFGVALCLSALRALSEEDPTAAEQSWFWSRFFNQAKGRLHKWDATGELTGWGRIKRVERLKDKIRASLDHPHITDTITPLQWDARPHVWRRTAPVISSDTSASRDTPMSSHTRQENIPCATTMPDLPVAAPTQAETLSAGRIGQAAGATELRLHRCWHMAGVILAVGDFVSRWSVLGGFFKLALVLLLCFAQSDIRSILYPPSLQPEWLGSSQRKGFQYSFDLNGAPTELRLDFRTSEHQAFLVVLTSDSYQDRIAKLQQDNPADPEYVVARFTLERRPGAQARQDPPQAKIRVRYPRELLRRHLRDQIVFLGPLPLPPSAGQKKQ